MVWGYGTLLYCVALFAITERAVKLYLRCGGGGAVANVAATMRRFWAVK